MKGQALTNDDTNTSVLELNQDTHSSEDEETKRILEHYLDELFSEEEQADLQKEEVTPEIRFTRFLWKIKFIEQELDKHQRVAEAMINEVSSWFDKKKSQLEGQIRFLCDQMQNYLVIQDLKSLSLPSGKIGFRNQQDKIEILDYDLFYSKALPALLRHVPESYEPDMKKIKEHIKTTSEIPEGIEVSSQDPKFYYKLNQNGGQ